MSSQIAEYLSSDETARYLGKSVATLKRWRRLRKGPPVTKIGATTLYRKAGIDDWLAGLEAVGTRQDSGPTAKDRRRAALDLRGAEALAMRDAGASLKVVAAFLGVATVEGARQVIDRARSRDPKRSNDRPPSRIVFAIFSAHGVPAQSLSPQKVADLIKTPAPVYGHWHNWPGVGSRTITLVEQWLRHHGIEPDQPPSVSELPDSTVD